METQLGTDWTLKLCAPATHSSDDDLFTIDYRKSIELARKTEG
jgi:hypothetical protein